jgi:hypothetical protein
MRRDRVQRAFATGFFWFKQELSPMRRDRVQRADGRPTFSDSTEKDLG